MHYYKLLGVFAGVTLIGYLYDRYNMKQLKEREVDEYDIVRKHLLGEKTLHLEQYKPTIWVHISYERNSRNWSSFYSRNSNDINIPYVYSVLSNLIKYCSFDFNVCFVNDSSFKRLLPNWNHDLSKVSGPSQYLLRELGMSKILHMYGGMKLNTNCLVTNELKTLYDTMLSEKDMFVGELKTEGVLFSKMQTFPSHHIMGCKKNSVVMKNYCDYLSNMIGRDYTDESRFSGELDKKLHTYITNKECELIPAHLLGVVDGENKLVDVDRLMDNQFIPLNMNMKMLYVDLEHIKSRTKYGWFLRQSKEQILENKNVIAEFIL
jgi:hypothetical protein